MLDPNQPSEAEIEDFARLQIDHDRALAMGEGMHKAVLRKLLDHAEARFSKFDKQLWVARVIAAIQRIQAKEKEEKAEAQLLEQKRKEEALRFAYVFHPVGQGLFSAGSVSDWTTGLDFNWVYDCGTSSAQELIDAAIRKFPDGRRHLNLVALSHFDRDHISGVCRLLKRFEVGTLLLPFTSLSQRLLLAFQDRISSSDPIMDCYIHPAAYFSAHADRGLRRILLVRPSSEGPPELRDAPPENPDVPRQTDSLIEDIAYESDANALADRDFTEQTLPGSSTTDTIVDVLREGSSIRVRYDWEFVPFNADVSTAIDGAFLKEVEKARRALLSPFARDLTEAALKSLKTIYDKHFGSDGPHRNVISLFLFAGPLPKQWGRTVMLSPVDYLAEPADTQGAEITDDTGQKTAILYTGDGSLKSESHIAKLIQYLRQSRVDRVGVFQVMHHGSERNWSPGLAARFAPSVSVISAGQEEHEHHPHPQVVSDFKGYGLAMATKSKSVVVSGRATAVRGIEGIFGSPGTYTPPWA